MHRLVVGTLSALALLLAACGDTRDHRAPRSDSPSGDPVTGLFDGGMGSTGESLMDQAAEDEVD